jgi:putative pyruvate formate lyase activating enzyme
VTATHVAPQAAAAVDLAREAGMMLPVVWNSNGYEKPLMVDLLADVVDVWLPDMKYGDDRHAAGCSGVGEYVAVSRAAVTAMTRQKGPLAADDPSAPLRGVIVRHLVLPGGLSDTDAVLAWIAGNLGREMPVSLMCQYFPAHLAVGEPLLGRRLNDVEWQEAQGALERHGIVAGWVQDFRSVDDDCPCHRLAEGCPGDGRCRSIA